MPSYRKVMADDKVVGVYTGNQPKWVGEIINLSGIHVEMASKKEYDKYRNRKIKKRKTENNIIPGCEKYFNLDL